MVEGYGIVIWFGDCIELWLLVVSYGIVLVGCGLLLGLVKLNIGYVQVVVGGLGFVKVILVVQYVVILLILYVDEFSCEIDWEKQGLWLVDKFMLWWVVDGWCIVVVFVFGMSGINSYVIVLMLDIVFVFECGFECGEV